MNTAIEEFCPDPIVVKCPICWNQFPFAPRWMQTVSLVGCPKCTVVIRVKAAQPAEFNSLSPSPANAALTRIRSEEHTSELQSHSDLVCRLLLEKKNMHDQEQHARYQRHPNQEPRNRDRHILTNRTDGRLNDAQAATFTPLTQPFAKVLSNVSL